MSTVKQSLAAVYYRRTSTREREGDIERERWRDGDIERQIEREIYIERERNLYYRDF